MGPVLVPIAVVGSLALGVASFQAQKKAAKAQQKAMKEQQKLQELADLRARRQMLRQRDVARGETVNLGAAYGAMGGTGLMGGLSGLNNQAMASLGWQQTGQAAAQRMTQLGVQASQYGTKAGMYDAIGSFFASLPGTISGASSVGSFASPYVPMLGGPATQ